MRNIKCINTVVREHNYFSVSFAVVYTHTLTYIHPHTHTYKYQQQQQIIVCVRVDRRLNKIKYDYQHYALHLFLFGKTQPRAHNNTSI